VQLKLRMIKGSCGKVCGNEEGEIMSRKVLTVELISKATAALDWLTRRTRMSETDVVNRALQLYRFFEEVSADGQVVLVKDRNAELTVRRGSVWEVSLSGPSMRVVK